MYVNTGLEICKTLTIDKKISGVSMSGYPKTYSMLAAFTVGVHSYGVLTEQEFQQLPAGYYEDRLADFKSYVQAAEEIYSIDAVTVVGSEAYRENLTSCPIGL